MNQGHGHRLRSSIIKSPVTSLGRLFKSKDWLSDQIRSCSFKNCNSKLNFEITLLLSKFEQQNLDGGLKF